MSEQAFIIALKENQRYILVYASIYLKQALT